MIPCVSTLSAAGLNVVLVRASVVDVDDGCDVLVNVLAFLLVAAKEILAVQQGVAAETKVTADFVDDVMFGVPETGLLKCTLRRPEQEGGKERKTARDIRRRVDI